MSGATKIPDIELSAKMRQLQARHRRLFPGRKPVHNDNINPSAIKPKVGGFVGLEKVTQASPLKILKNHAFDKLFSKAGDNNPGNASHIEIAHPPKLKVMKNHQFDKLFTKAGDSNPGNASVIEIADQSDFHLKVMKDHQFDKLFAKAGEQSQVGLGHDKVMSKSQHCRSEILQNHKFDQLFAKAGDCHTSYVSNASNGIGSHDELEHPFVTLKNHDDSGIDLGLTSPPEIIPQRRFDERFKSVKFNLRDNVPELLTARRMINWSQDDILKKSHAQSNGILENDNVPCGGIFEAESSPESSFITSDFCERNATSSTEKPNFFGICKTSGTTPSSSTKASFFTSDFPPRRGSRSTEKLNFSDVCNTSETHSTFTIDYSDTRISLNQMINKNMQVSHDYKTSKIHEKATTSTSNVDHHRRKYTYGDMIERLQSGGDVGVKWNTPRDGTIVSGEVSWSKKQVSVPTNVYFNNF